MLSRISLIVAIIAGLAVGALNFVKIKENITTLRTDLANETSARQSAESERDQTKATLDKTNAELNQTKQSLETANSQREKAVSEAAAQSRRVAQLTDELNETKKVRDDAQADLARYKNTGRSPEQILALDKSLKDAKDAQAEAELLIAAANKKIKKLEIDLEPFIKGREPIVYLPAELKGKVVVSDPKWDFVVVNIGEDQGVLEKGELLVNRNGKLVAKVKVTSVQKDRAVANVMPGWKLGEPLEGDQVIPAHPAS